MPYVIRGEIQRVQALDLLGNASTYVPHASILKVVVPHIKDAQSVVSPQD